MLHRRLVIMGKEFCLAAGQCGKGPPTESTVGCEGATYMDTDTKEMYKCTSCDNGVYTWEPLVCGVSLPEVSGADDGKILKVVDGAWAAAAATALVVEIDGEEYDLGIVEIDDKSLEE